MITISKTNDFKSPYEAPRCKAFSFTAESCILAGSEDYGGSGEAGPGFGDGGEHDL